MNNAMKNVMDENDLRFHEWETDVQVKFKKEYRKQVC